MTYIVTGGALNSTNSTQLRSYDPMALYKYAYYYYYYQICAVEQQAAIRNRLYGQPLTFVPPQLVGRSVQGRCLHRRASLEPAIGHAGSSSHRSLRSRPTLPPASIRR